MQHARSDLAKTILNHPAFLEVVAAVLPPKQAAHAIASCARVTGSRDTAFWLRIVAGRVDAYRFEPPGRDVDAMDHVDIASLVGYIGVCTPMKVPLDVMRAGAKAVMAITPSHVPLSVLRLFDDAYCGDVVRWRIATFFRTPEFHVWRETKLRRKLEKLLSGNVRFVPLDVDELIERERGMLYGWPHRGTIEETARRSARRFVNDARARIVENVLGVDRPYPPRPQHPRPDKWSDGRPLHYDPREHQNAPPATCKDSDQYAIFARSGAADAVRTPAWLGKIDAFAVERMMRLAPADMYARFASTLVKRAVETATMAERADGLEARALTAAEVAHDVAAAMKLVIMELDESRAGGSAPDDGETSEEDDADEFESDDDDAGEFESDDDVGEFESDDDDAGEFASDDDDDPVPDDGSSGEDDESGDEDDEFESREFVAAKAKIANAVAAWPEWTPADPVLVAIKAVYETSFEAATEA